MKLIRSLILLIICLGSCLGQGNSKPNILLITVDDMSCDSVSSFGCKLKGITPSIDKLAFSGIRFSKAHVQVGNCYPSRNVLLSGRYPHNSGVEGFYQVKPINYPVISDLMKGGGYFTAIRGKVSHSTPYQPYDWDADLTELPNGSKAHTKDPKSYYISTKAGINSAIKLQKPFFLNINVSDPHKPFWKPGDAHPSSRIYKASEIPIPKFLHDDPVIREELALYYSSVRRADDCVGQTLKALEDSGELKSTVIIFLSDHGMPFPFAKTQLYHHSTHTPLIISWPGIAKAGSVDNQHMVSAIDFLPTILDIANLEIPTGVQGRTFVDLIKGKDQQNRNMIFKEYNENSGGIRNPMRGIQTHNYLYLFNPWSNGQRNMATATNGTATWKRMLALATQNPTINARVQVMRHRTVEELYDIQKDPDCLVNLINSKEHTEKIKELQKSLHEWMGSTKDHAITAFSARTNSKKMESYIKIVQTESDFRRKKKRKKRPNISSDAPI